MLGPDLFGDRVNLYRGSLRVRPDGRQSRRQQRPARRGNAQALHRQPGNYGQGLFSEWELEIPHMQGTFHGDLGWVRQTSPGVNNNLRCTNFGAPPDTPSQPLAPDGGPRNIGKATSSTSPAPDNRKCCGAILRSTPTSPTTGRQRRWSLRVCGRSAAWVRWRAPARRRRPRTRAKASSPSRRMARATVSIGLSRVQRRWDVQAGERGERACRWNASTCASSRR